LSKVDTNSILKELDLYFLPHLEDDISIENSFNSNMVNNNKLKIFGPLIGTGLTGAFGYYAGVQQSQTAKEIEIIKAQTAKGG
jgi:hypothetical protein